MDKATFQYWIDRCGELEEERDKYRNLLKIAEQRLKEYESEVRRLETENSNCS